jgi:hypothetical protein
MTPYQYLNTNNNQTADLSYNEKAKAYIDSLLANPTITHSYLQPLMARDEDGNRTNVQATDENGQPLYQVGSGEDSSTSTNNIDRTYLNGYEVTPSGDNRYSVGIDDPTSKGYFNINAQIDPTTNKLSGLGSTYGSHGHFDYLQPAMFAALVGGGLLAAPYLGGAALAEGAGAGALTGEGALAGGGTVGADVAGGGAVAGGGGAAGGGSGVGLGTGTAYSADALTNPLNPFYGTAQASPTSLGLVSGGGGSTIGEGSIIGSGAGLGQTVPASLMSGLSGASNLSKLPNLKSGTTQQNMANALRSNLDTSVTVKPLQNPFLTNNQQVLANMLKV